MPILPPKITGDGVEDSWNKSVTDQLNELEISLQTQLEVTDVQSANYDGSPQLPANLLSTTRTQAETDALVGNTGYFLDANVGTIVTEDLLLRGTMASESQIVNANESPGGFVLDGISGTGQFTHVNFRGSLTSGNALVDLGTLSPTRAQIAASTVLSDQDAWVITQDGAIYADQIACNGIAAGAGVFPAGIDAGSTRPSVASQNRVGGANPLLNVTVTTLEHDASYVAAIATRFTPPSQATLQPAQPRITTHEFYVPPASFYTSEGLDSSGNGWVSHGLIRSANQSIGELQTRLSGTTLSLHILLSTSGGNVDDTMTTVRGIFKRS